VKVVRRLIFVALTAAVAGGGAAARASERVDVNATAVKLAVNSCGTALVRVLQVHFRFDWSGGWKSQHRLAWKHFRNGSTRYEGPELAYLVAACKAPDGTYWSLQARQPYLLFCPTQR
jgi:hypothetical protein